MRADNNTAEAPSGGTDDSSSVASRGDHRSAHEDTPGPRSDVSIETARRGDDGLRNSKAARGLADLMALLVGNV